MRNKLAAGGVAVVIGFLLATNPVVVNAAGQITSGMIKNNTIKSIDVKDNNLKGKDIKDSSLTGADVANGSLTAADLAAGTIPAPSPQIKALKRFSTTTNSAIPVSAALGFVGPTSAVTVDGNDTVAATASVAIDGVVAGDDIDFAICFSTGGAPAALGGTAALFDDIDLVTDDNVLVPQAIDVLPAGTYNIGACVAAAETQNFQSVVGIVTVYDGTGALAKAGGDAKSNADAG
jgi:hypothetical protein